MDVNKTGLRIVIEGIKKELERGIFTDQIKVGLINELGFDNEESDMLLGIAGIERGMAIHGKPEREVRKTVSEFVREFEKLRNGGNEFDASEVSAQLADDIFEELNGDAEDDPRDEFPEVWENEPDDGWLESAYEDRFAMYDDDPDPYGGTYSEM